MKLNLKQAGVALCFFLLSGGMQAQEKAPKLVVNLDKAIEIALSENPTIKVADLEIERKDYSKRETIAGLFPAIGASGDYSRALKMQKMYMDNMSALGGGSSTPTTPEEIEQAKQMAESMKDGIEIGRDNTITLGFNFQLPIIAPALWKSVQMSKADVEQTLEAARSSRLSLVNEVKKSYYNVLMTQDSYLVLKQSYDNAKLNAENFKNKYKQGTASEYDVLRSQVQVRNLEPGLLQAENGVALAKLQLKTLLGVDMSIDIEAANRLSEYEQQMYADVLSVDTSLQNNTELRKLDLQTNYLRKVVDVQRMSWYPTLSASGMYSWMSMVNDGGGSDMRWNPYSTIGLSLSIPIFQGGARHYKIKQAKLSVSQMGYQRDNLVRNLTMQVQMSMDNIQKSVKQIASNKEGVTQAEKAYSIMQKSFEIGSATFVDVNDADLALTSSRLSYYQAIYDYLTARSELELVLGNTNLEAYKKSK